MFVPIIIGKAEANTIAPEPDIACNIPTAAALDCVHTVIIAPASTPSRGFCSTSNIFLKTSSSAKGSTAVLIVFIPVNSIATPIRINPMFFLRFLFENMISMMPAIASIAEKLVGFIRSIRKLPFFEPSSFASRSICAVIVVPMFAPIIIPTAPRSFKMPAFTRPITMTVVAVDDCTAAVTTAPKKILVKIFPDIFASTFSSKPPDAFSSPLLSVFMPNIKNARPPIATKMLNTLKTYFPFYFLNPLLLLKLFPYQLVYLAKSNYIRARMRRELMFFSICLKRSHGI